MVAAAGQGADGPRRVARHDHAGVEHGGRVINEVATVGRAVSAQSLVSPAARTMSKTTARFAVNAWKIAMPRCPANQVAMSVLESLQMGKGWARSTSGRVRIASGMMPMPTWSCCTVRYRHSRTTTRWACSNPVPGLDGKPRSVPHPAVPAAGSRYPVLLPGGRPDPAQESINARKHFPTEAAALKCVYLAIMSNAGPTDRKPPSTRDHLRRTFVRRAEVTCHKMDDKGSSADGLMADGPLTCRAEEACGTTSSRTAGRT